MRIKIKRWDTNAVIHAGDFSDLCAAVSDAVAKKIDLYRASLNRASLNGARLDGASLNGASLNGASLNGVSLNDASLNGASLNGASLNGVSLNDASLNGASLVGASLDGASLNGARLNDASLNGASLNGASLNGVSLNGARLDGASLNGARLDGANLDGYRRDLEHMLFCHPNEAAGVLAALREGRVNGSVYEGECACLVGTIANLKGCKVAEWECDSSRPAESWFMQFRPGMTPKNHNSVKLTCDWIENWIAKYGPKAAV